MKKEKCENCSYFANFFREICSLETYQNFKLFFIFSRTKNSPKNVVASKFNCAKKLVEFSPLRAHPWKFFILSLKNIKFYFAGNQGNKFASLELIIKIKLEELRDHIFVPVVMHKFDLPFCLMECKSCTVVNRTWNSIIERSLEIQFL